jgi:hypothetical protein
MLRFSQNAELARQAVERESERREARNGDARQSTTNLDKAHEGGGVRRRARAKSDCAWVGSVIMRDLSEPS